jgi:hypothetical protein
MTHPIREKKPNKYPGQIIKGAPTKEEIGAIKHHLKSAPNFSHQF